MNRSAGSLALSFLVILAPSIHAGSEVRTQRQTSEAVLDSIFNIPITTLEAVSNLVKQTSSRRRAAEEGTNLQRVRRDVGDDFSFQDEGRTFHHFKKKKHKFHHHQKPINFGFFGHHVQFPEHHIKPTVWKPSHSIPSFINIFTHGDESHGHHKPHHKPHYKPHYKPHHKPHESHSQGHYEVWEDVQEDVPNPWQGVFYALGPHYSPQNKVAPKNVREYRSYTTAPIFTESAEKTFNDDFLKDDFSFQNTGKFVFKD